MDLLEKLRGKTEKLHKMLKNRKPTARVSGFDQARVNSFLIEQVGRMKPSSREAEFAYRRVWEINELLIPKPSVCLLSIFSFC